MTVREKEREMKHGRVQRSNESEKRGVSCR